eukprot:TRINITY_DN7522_c0_g1_i1.p1 TRINITY_DN7522_c0_g1~~TRINITY_DN7522_c0_g1_i1.p1  ORF type:complete len:181 (+),score=67.66 TRINITY_DN7522_c0_g1_i1:43-543(+)
MVAIDQTQQFHELVKLKSKEVKLFSLTEREKEILRKKEEERQKKQKKIKVIVQQALGIQQRIQQLWIYLQDQQEDYLDPNSQLVSRASSMKEEERDKIDREAKFCLSTCCESIDALKLLIGGIVSEEKNQQEKEHLSGVIMVLYKRLELVTELYSSQRTFRYKKSR